MKKKKNPNNNNQKPNLKFYFNKFHQTIKKLIVMRSSNI